MASKGKEALIGDRKELNKLIKLLTFIWVLIFI